MGDAPPQENGRVGQIRKIVLWGLFSSLPIEIKMSQFGYLNGIFGSLGVWKGPLGG